MKQTFSHKYFDWVLITISLLFSIEAVLNIFSGFTFFSSYSFQIVVALVSIMACISLLANNVSGERYSRFFIIILLLVPAILILNIYFTDLAFYGVNRTNLLQNPNLYIKLIIGIVLLVLSIKYSKQDKSNRIKDYGILTLSIGIYAFLFVLIRVIETNILPELNEFSIWKIIIKSIIGLVITYFGFRLKNNGIKLKTSLIITLSLIFIYGLV